MEDDALSRDPGPLVRSREKQKPESTNVDPGLPIESTCQLLCRVHTHATIGVDRFTILAAGGQWHEDVIVLRVSRDAVGVAVRGDVLQPLPGPRIDDSENRAAGHVSRSQVIVVVAGGIPGLIHEPDIVDGSEDLAGGAVDNDCVRRERPPVMIGATHHYIGARPEIQTGRHAAEYRKAVN